MLSECLLCLTFTKIPARFREADASDILATVRSVEGRTSSAEGSHIYLEETFFPIIDGEDITDFPVNLLKAGEWHKDKDMIIGVNTEESLDFQFYFPAGVTVDEDKLKVSLPIFQLQLFSDKLGQGYCRISLCAVSHHGIYTVVTVE